MTIKELENKIESYGPVSYGHFNIAIRWHGNCYHCTSTNTMAYDRAIDGRHQYIFDSVKEHGMTYKQALTQLYNECKRKNNL